MITLLAFLFAVCGMAYAEQPVRPQSDSYIKGVEALNDGDPVTAYEFLSNELEQHPDNGYAHCYMALICNYCGEVKLAFQAFQNSLDLIPESDPEYRSFAYYSRGVLLTGLKQWELAESDLDEAIRLNPSDSENFKARARLFLETQQYEASLDDLQEALKLDSRTDVNDLVWQLMTMAPSEEFMERVSATYRMIGGTEVR